MRLRVPPTFQLPDLSEVDGVDTAVPAPATSGTTVVVDTEDLALARWGVRLAHDGTAWQLVLPEHPGGPTVAPTHHALHTSPRTIPAAARHACRRLAGDAELGRVARLEVRREGTGLVRDGGLQVHVSDEEISVHTGRRLTGRFREVVLQAGPDTDGAVIEAVEAALHDAGALDRDDIPRPVRILGPAAVADPDLPAVPDAEDGEADAAWRAALVDGLADLLVADAHLRLDDTGRTAPATVAVVDGVLGLVELLDGDATVATGLATLRSLLDEVDRHAQRLAVLGADLPQLEERGRAAVKAAVRALHDHQDGDAHAEMIAGLRALADAPGLDAEEAAGAARASVAARVDKRWAPIAGSLTPDEPHGAPLLAALGAAAAIAPGKAPRRFAVAAGAAATAARDHERALRVQRWLAEQAPALPPDEAFRAGHLAGRRDGDAIAARAAWAAAVERLTSKKATKWLP
ncbi:MAG: hypothetical protein U5L04_11450 [Trueperaceae bacterium]|nr:hypothetical protein [Trueperaceae bacterium]